MTFICVVDKLGVYVRTFLAFLAYLVQFQKFIMRKMYIGRTPMM